jgi:polysaccharide export outer membrane protein
MKSSEWVFFLSILLLLPIGRMLAQENATANVQNSAIAGNSGADSGVSKVEPQLRERRPRYRVAGGDSFDVSFELSPEFNQTVTVQPDGFVTMRGVGDLFVLGKSVPELTEMLQDSYGKILNKPIISVLLKDFEKPYFIADGQVGHPGKYDLRGDATVTQAIAVAGGFLPSAKHSQVLLFRRVSNEWVEARIINVKKMQKDGNLHEDPHLHPGDMLFVPKNTFSKIDRFLPTANVGSYIRP